MKAEKSDARRYRIAANLHSLLQEQMIVAHIHIILAFVRAWWGGTLSWHKNADLKTRQPGFLARHMAVHCYIQVRYLKNLQKKRATNEHFGTFIQTFPQNETYTKEELLSKFLERSVERHAKHFKQRGENVYLSLACEDPQVPQLISAWLLGIPPQHKRSLFSSHTPTTLIFTPQTSCVFSCTT